MGWNTQVTVTGVTTLISKLNLKDPVLCVQSSSVLYFDYPLRTNLLWFFSPSMSFICCKLWSVKFAMRCKQYSWISSISMCVRIQCFSSTKKTKTIERPSKFVWFFLKIVLEQIFFKKICCLGINASFKVLIM